MIMVSIAVGLITGIISGMGIGGGSLLVLYLTAVTGMPQYMASGTNLLYFLFCAPAALISHVRNHRVVWRAVLWCTVVGVITSAAAAFLAAWMPTDWLRRLFGGLLLYVGVRELFCRKKAK